MASWNVRILNQTEAMRNLIGKPKKYGIITAAIQMIEWRGNNVFYSEDYTICYSGVLEQGTFLCWILCT